MSLKNIFFVTVFLFSSIQLFAQRNYDDYNRLGINGGYAIFDLTTDDLTTKQGGGFIAGFTSRGAFRNNFDLIYGLSFASEQVSVLVNSPISADIFQNQYLEYTIQGAQVHFLGSYNIVKHHLSVEFGPMLHVSGKMKLQQERFEDYIVDGYQTLRAQDIQDISTINFRTMAGITAGIQNFRVSAQYQYGVTNTLNKLNGKNLENTDFKGNTSTILIAAVVYF